MSTDRCNAIVPDETHASLQLVAREIAAELNEARVALEAFAEQPEDRGALHRFAAHVHLGARRAAPRRGLRRRAARRGDGAGRALRRRALRRTASADADGLDALMRAMEQLPTYVERVPRGGRDVPLALLPLLNDLRAVRGGALLSEGTLLLLNLRSDEPARPGRGAASRLTVADLARRLRPRFQLALLGWIRGEQRRGRTSRRSPRSPTQLESAATTQPLFQLWWVVGAVLEALREGGLDGSVSIKRLLGHADREMRRLYEQGEAAYADAPPIELLNNLLYYVARAQPRGPRVAAVRASFRLDELLPRATQAETRRSETLSAPSVRLMKTVAAAIREDLTRVKDVLDIFVRKGATQVDDLVPQLEMLHKIATRSACSASARCATACRARSSRLQAIVDRRMPPDDDGAARRSPRR